VLIRKIALTLVYCAATLTLAACGSGDDASTSTPPGPQTWFFSDGAALTAGQITNFGAQGLYYNVHSAANPTGEIRGQIAPSSTTFITDNGDPTTGNTFSALMSGAQEVPTNTSRASAYGTIVLDPVANTISGVLVTNGIAGTLAHIHNGLPGVSGPIIFPLTGGPTVWTLPTTPITDPQIVLLRAGAYYLNVHTAALPAGELRGQLTQQVRFAELNIANEPAAIAPALPSSGTAVLALGTTALANGNFPISGFVKTSGIVSATIAHIHEGAPGVVGPPIVLITETPAGSGLWVVPAGATLTPAQVASFNTGNLYYNVHTALNPGGEIRGPILAATVRIGNATLTGANEVPAVTTTASGTGIIALNSITQLVNGNVFTTGIVGTVAHVHAAAAGVAGPIIVPLTLTPPPSTLQPASLAVSTTSLANGSIGTAYSQSLVATGGTSPYTWAVTIGTLPAGLTLSTAGVISGTPTAAGTSSFTVRVTDSAAATATMALSINITAAAPATVLFSTQIQPIFTANCVNCHNVSLPSFPNLTIGNSFASLVQSASPAVIAGSSATSRLFVRISTSTPSPQMPLGLPPLSDADQTLIQTWINQGAANN
jgi:CHRD domain-containing protein/putative Ig domain-containing protein